MINVDSDFQKWLDEGKALQQEVFSDLVSDILSKPNDVPLLHKMTARLSNGLADDCVVSEFDKLDDSLKRIVLKAAVHSLMLVEIGLRLKAHQAIRSADEGVCK